MLIKKLTLSFLLLLSIQAVLAHAPWIETSPTGVKGKAQPVKIYFGEFADKDISQADKWFSDLKDFSLVLIAPDGTTSALTATAAGDHYKASFTPDKDGVYTLAFHHTVKDVYHNMKLDYNSNASVVVGGQLNGNDPAVNKNIISLFAENGYAARKDKSVVIKAFYDHKPAAGKEIKVFAPNGWGKELYSSDSGEVTFTPLWPGKYMAEFAYADKTPGEHNGKAYTEIWEVVTYIIEVK